MAKKYGAARLADRPVGSCARLLLNGLEVGCPWVPPSRYPASTVSAPPSVVAPATGVTVDRAFAAFPAAVAAGVAEAALAAVDPFSVEPASAAPGCAVCPSSVSQPPAAGAFFPFLVVACAPAPD